MPKKLLIPKINKEIVVYEYGTEDKLILLVHGWSGRGTQLVKIADELLKNNYKVISFDAPAHGKSSSRTTLMIEFIECIMEIQKLHSPFYAAIGHSLGGMAILNAKNWGLKVQKMVTIGAGNSITEITEQFVQKLGLHNNQVDKLKTFFEKKYQLKMNDFASDINAEKIDIPEPGVLDVEDDECLQRVGLGTPDVPATVAVLRERGVEFVTSKGVQFDSRGALTRTALGNVMFELVHHVKA